MKSPRWSSGGFYRAFVQSGTKTAAIKLHIKQNEAAAGKTAHAEKTMQE